MPYQVLARKYRPLRFSDVLGQDHVTRTLQNSLEQNRIAHAYIFSGHRGIGKTTIARILASALNCQRTIGSAERPTPEPCLVCDSCVEIRQGNAVDVIEIDAATNRGIDEIRELRDAARYRPARDRFKIYILDEAHQITDAAFNALLKTLEEPPDHIVFMMATTEPENIPQTIRSRCQHYSFHAVKLDDILTQLKKIAADEGVDAEPAALDLLAEAGDGSMRDALSIMDQAIASAPVVGGKAQLAAAEIRELMGSVPNTVFEEILGHVNTNGAAGVLTVAARLLDAGNSPAQIARQFVRYLRNCVVASLEGLTDEHADSDLLQISTEERRRVARSAALFTEEELTRFLQVTLRTFDDLGFRQEQRFHLELGLVKLVHLQRLLPMEQFLSRLPAVKKESGASGSGGPQRVPPVRQMPAVISKLAGTSAAPFAGSVEMKRAHPPAAVPGEQIVPETPARTGADDASSAERPSIADEAMLPEAADPLSTHAPEAVHGAQAVSARETMQESAVVSEVTGVDDQSAAVRPAEVANVDDGVAAEPHIKPEGPDVSALQTAAVEALFAAKSMNSAAEQMEGTAWSLVDGEVRVQTSLSKQMAAAIFRPEVEAVIRGALQQQGLAGVRLAILPGSKIDAPKAAKKPRVGSAQAKALEHPTVQAAQRLFNAEITSVFDLRRD